jgi:sugar diacid utilization regulator
MNIEIISDCLKDIIMRADTPIEYCNAEEGIRFLCPPPNVPVPGTVFAGTLSEWEMLNSFHKIFPNCTYLVCTDGETPPSAAFTDCLYNLFILNASVKTMLHKLTFLLSSQSMLSDAQQNQLYADFWHSIMDCSIEAREQAMAFFQRFPYQVHTHMACIVVSPDSPEHDALRIREIQLALHDFFKETNLFYENREWIILYSQEKDTSVELDISYEAFSQLLNQYHLNAGISYVCQLPEQFRILYLTASASIQIGQRMKISPYMKRIYTYHQYNPYYVIHLCSQKFTEIHNTKNLVYLVHPDVVRLYYYDLENKNNLLDVLFAYLSCAQNISLAAQTLYMHRNTVLNKLNKIESFLHHKPFTEKDHWLILFSCMILKYQCTQNEITDFFPL